MSSNEESGELEKMKTRFKMRVAALWLSLLIADGVNGSERRACVESYPGMALVPAGRYTPLFRAEGDPKDIPVDAFLLDVLPVTNADFLEFVRTTRRGVAHR